MAAGDVVSGIGLLNTDFFFQPAAGVEVMISTATVYTGWTYLHDGITDSLVWNNALSTSGQNFGNSPEKIFINNTIYLKIQADPTYTANFTGVQIK